MIGWRGSYICSQRGAAGPKTLQDSELFQKWAKTLLNRRVDSWRKDLPLLRIFRHEALSSVQFNLRGIMSESTAEDLSRITKDVILAFAAELQLAKRTSAALNAHPGMHAHAVKFIRRNN